MSKLDAIRDGVNRLSDRCEMWVLDRLDARSDDKVEHRTEIDIRDFGENYRKKVEDLLGNAEPTEMVKCSECRFWISDTTDPEYPMSSGKCHHRSPRPYGQFADPFPVTYEDQSCGDGRKR